VRPYRGSLVLFISEATACGYDDAVYHSPSFGWEKFVDGKIKTYRIPGDHNSLVTPPGVKELVRHIEELLADAEGRAR
jgi:thioesterase domain-containing protein